MRKLLILATSILVLFSCSEKQEELSYQVDKGTNQSQALGEILLEHEIAEDIRTKKIEGVEYHYSVVNALDFIRRSGGHVDKEDIEGLEKESVVIFEFKTEKATQNAFESKEMKLGKDDAIQYLMSGISTDIVIKQNGKEFKPSGCNYEGQIGEQNELRFMFFINGLNTDNPFTIEYYDQLFGNGLMKFTNSNQQILS